MKKLKIHLEHCYGIKQLDATFDFSRDSTHAVYAPNGTMKSSLARVFKDISTGAASRDRVFPARTTKRLVQDEKGADVRSEAILVLPPYDEMFGDAGKTATLLVDSALRAEYERLYKDVELAKIQFLADIKTLAHSKRSVDEIETEIAAVFAPTGGFYQALINARPVVSSLSSAQFATIPYDLIGDPKVVDFLAKADVKAVLKGYIDQYNELLAKSKYFRKGGFDYHHASEVAKELKKHRFFHAGHSLNLKADSPLQINDEKGLDAAIAAEKEEILRDAKLMKAFNGMEAKITKNEMLREFQEFLTDNKEALARMGDPEKLKADIWLSYFKELEPKFNDLVAKREEAHRRGQEIEAEAAKQRTDWEEVVEIFNQRFFVPFVLEITNKVSVVLGSADVPSLGFRFHDGDEHADVQRKDLLETLSTGERKALYILNVIFEIEVRRKAQAETVFVVDDIADSFDYKNKYAIIQYLKDISEEGCFRQIILTHNFDFFRTVESRFVPYSHCHMVQRSASGLTLEKATGIKNIFAKDWKPSFFKNARKRIAAISFVRNIVEYTRGDADPAYIVLTKLLHWKSGTESVTHAELDAIYKAVFTGDGAWPAGGVTVVETIHEEASACLSAPQGPNFENKIVLAIATRLHAEKYMVTEIADPVFVSQIAENQTTCLLKKYRASTTASRGALQILERVALMTPENIHLNAFMYEPIIDMSDEHLRSLYKDVRGL